MNDVVWRRDQSTTAHVQALDVLDGTSLMQHGTGRARRALLESVCEQASPAHQQAAQADAGRNMNSGHQGQAACRDTACATSSDWVAELSSRGTHAQCNTIDPAAATSDVSPLTGRLGFAVVEDAGADSGSVRSLRELMGDSVGISFLQHVLHQHHGDVAVRVQGPARMCKCIASSSCRAETLCAQADQACD